MLSEFDPGVLAQAVVYVAKTSKWFPSIAEIRDACLEVSGSRAKLPAVGEAFTEARRAASSIGSYAKPTAEDFSHAIVHRAAVQAAGSWRRWCLSEDEAALRARFFEVYRELRAREVQQLSLPPSARQLTAEESRAALEDLNTRAARAALPAPADTYEAKPLSELIAKRPPPSRGVEVVGGAMTDAEFETRKTALVEAAREA